MTRCPSSRGARAVATLGWRTSSAGQSLLLTARHTTTITKGGGSARRAGGNSLGPCNLVAQLLPEEDGQRLNAGNNQADALDAQGKYAEAETMYLEVLAVQRRVLGPEHPSTLRTSSNLGNTLMHRGKSAQAETIFLELIAVHVSVCLVPSTQSLWR
jgi:hypothetical protein